MFSLTPDIIACIISFAAIVISFMSYCSSKRINDEQLKKISQQQLPNLKIVSVLFPKNSSSNNDYETIKNHNYCRIFSGSKDSIFNNDTFPLKSLVPVFSTTTINQIESGFIEEVNANINKIYFTYFLGEPYLVINHAKAADNFVIDHSNVKITLHNYGAPISAISIESLKIHYNDPNISSLEIDGSSDKISISPEENEKLVIYFDEVTTDLENSMCSLPEETYTNIPPLFNLLKHHMPHNVLKYNKLEFSLICWDMYNLPKECLITLAFQNTRFISSTITSDLV